MKALNSQKISRLIKSKKFLLLASLIIAILVVVGYFSFAYTPAFGTGRYFSVASKGVYSNYGIFKFGMSGFPAPPATSLNKWYPLNPGNTSLGTWSEKSNNIGTRTLNDNAVGSDVKAFKVILKAMGELYVRKPSYYNVFANRNKGIVPGTEITKLKNVNADYNQVNDNDSNMTSSGDAIHRLVCFLLRTYPWAKTTYDASSENYTNFCLLGGWHGHISPKMQLVLLNLMTLPSMDMGKGVNFNVQSETTSDSGLTTGSGSGYFIYLVNNIPFNQLKSGGNSIEGNLVTPVWINNQGGTNNPKLGTRNLKRGDTGDDVRVFQALLRFAAKKTGARGTIPSTELGTYGPSTEALVNEVHQIELTIGSPSEGLELYSIFAKYISETPALYLR